MKVILLKDVAKIGKRFSVTEVPDGYALNKLIPSGQAIAATKENLAQLSKRQQKAGMKQQEQIDAFKAQVTALGGTSLTVTVDANEQGHLFRAVPKELVLEAARVAGIATDGVEVEFSEPIKSVGDHSITLQFADERASVIVSVVAKA